MSNKKCKSEALQREEFNHEGAPALENMERDDVLSALAVHSVLGQR